MEIGKQTETVPNKKKNPISNGNMSGHSFELKMRAELKADGN